MSNPMRKITLITLLTFGLVGVLLPYSAGATDDSPCGGLYDLKIEPLSGKTFTVPTPPAGWTVEFVVLKVGGPDGGTHISFPDADAGDVLSVAYQQYDISHAHVCKTPPQETTTSTSTTSTTTTTVVATTVPESSSTTTPDSVPETSSTSSPSTSSPDTTTTTTSAPPSSNAPTTTVSGPTTSTPPSPRIPATGDNSGWFVLAGAVIGFAGVALVTAARRR